ncbi:MAG: class III signal peptide-containing protein [Pseudomonadota bacterium]
MRKRLINKKGQVAVEFMFMFIIVISVIIYAFYFSFSLSSLHYRNYETFMIGRSVFASSLDYKTKKSRAESVMAGFQASAHNTTSSVTKDFQCTLDGEGSGFRGILDYGSGKSDFYIYTNAGIACSVSAGYLLPSVITRSSGGSMTLAMDAMTGSEISDKHCECLLSNTNNKWSDCLGEQTSNNKPFIDNGC